MSVKTLLLATVALIPFYRFLEVSIAGVGVSVVDLLIVLTVVLCLAGKARLSSDARLALLFCSLFVVALIISTLANSGRMHSVIFTLSAIVKIGLLFSIVVVIRSDVDRVKLIKAMVWSTVFVAILAIAQQSSNVSEFGDIASVAGTYAARNEMLSMLVPTTLLSLYLNRTQRKSLVYGSFFLLQFIAILVSRGRFGLIVCLLGIVAVFVAARGAGSLSALRFTCFMLAVSLASYFLVSPYFDELYLRYGSSLSAELTEERGSAFIRIAVTRGVLQAWSENVLLGIGPGSFVLESARYVQLPMYDSIQPHNTYFGLLAETGLFGFGLFFALILVVLKVILLRLRLQSRESRVLTLAILIGTSSELIMLIGFDGLLRYPLWLFLGLALSVAIEYRRQSDRTLIGDLVYEHAVNSGDRAGRQG